MKKFLTILMATILATFCLAMVGCNKDKTLKESDIIGTYTCVDSHYAENSKLKPKENSLVNFEIKSDKTFVVTSVNGDNDIIGNWEINGSKLILFSTDSIDETNPVLSYKDENDNYYQMSFEYSDGYLTYSKSVKITKDNVTVTCTLNSTYIKL